MHQAGQPALPGVGQVHREKVSLSNTVGCAPPASSLPLRSTGAGGQELHQERAQRSARGVTLGAAAPYEEYGESRSATGCCELA